jgi:6-phosphogluconolactonase
MGMKKESKKPKVKSRRGKKLKKKKFPVRKAQIVKVFKPEVHVAPDLNALYHDLADLFVRTAREAVEKRGRFMVALSGGESPTGLFRLLAGEPFRSEVPWGRTFVFWWDERHVPLDHPDSNYKMALDLLLSRVGVSPSRLFPMTDGVLPPEKAAYSYEKTLKSLFGSRGLPAFDFNLMGMGPDGHTASLFPKRAQLKERKKWVVGYWVDAERKSRVTLTFPVLNASRLTVVLIEGPKKANLLRTVMEAKPDPEKYPIQYLSTPPGGRLLFALDNRAAVLLSKRPVLLDGN